MNIDAYICIIDNMHILFFKKKQLHNYKNDLPLPSLFHMKTTVSVTKRLHQDCGPVLFTLTYFCLLHRLFTSVANKKLVLYIYHFSLNMFSLNHYCFTQS